MFLVNCLIVKSFVLPVIEKFASDSKQSSRNLLSSLSLIISNLFLEEKCNPIRSISDKRSSALLLNSRYLENFSLFNTEKYSVNISSEIHIFTSFLKIISLIS